MRLMTVWEAYQLVVAKLEYGRSLAWGTKAQQDNLYRKKLRFREYITGHIDDYDHMMWERREV